MARNFYEPFFMNAKKTANALIQIGP